MSHKCTQMSHLIIGQFKLLSILTMRVLPLTDSSKDHTFHTKDHTFHTKHAHECCRRHPGVVHVSPLQGAACIRATGKGKGGAP